jgi:hypothetical protein
MRVDEPGPAISSMRIAEQEGQGAGDRGEDRDDTERGGQAALW